MLYDSIKIFHIISASLTLTSMAYSYGLWLSVENSNQVMERIQTQTWAVIVPFAILQLLTGFTMMSLKHYGLSQFWMAGSITGFIVAVSSWLAFVYCLLSSNQRAQSIMLSICGTALLCMIFLMANKI